MYDYRSLSPNEQIGYAKALLDVIDVLRHAEKKEGNGIIAAGMRVASVELIEFRNSVLASKDEQ